MILAPTSPRGSVSTQPSCEEILQTLAEGPQASLKDSTRKSFSKASSEGLLTEFLRGFLQSFLQGSRLESFRASGLGFRLQGFGPQGLEFRMRA